jgi:hypothetical protein
VPTPVTSFSVPAPVVTSFSVPAPAVTSFRVLSGPAPVTAVQTVAPPPVLIGN